MKMLNDKQWMEIYTASIETRKDITWLRKALECNKREIDECRENVKNLEVKHSFQKGKVASISIGLTALFTIIVNAALWIFTRWGR